METPESFAYVSHIYVWCGEVNLAVHMVPPPLTHESLQLGTLTRAVYHTLETVEGGLNLSGCFVMLHFEEATNKLHVTMLPVGDPVQREQLDAEIKETGLTTLLRQLSDVVETSPNGVRIMYNTPEVMDTIVHELGASRPEMERVLGGFLALVRPGL